MHNIGSIGDRVSCSMWDRTVPAWQRFGSGLIVLIESAICQSGWMYSIENADGRVLRLDCAWLTELESRAVVDIFGI